MIVRILVLSLAGSGFAILQSTLLTQIIPFQFVPDIALLLLIAASWRYGSMTGELTGFFIGIAFDALSLAPLGFHTFLFTVLGYLYGKLQGSISPGPVFLPAVAALAATLIKYGGALLLSAVFGLNSGGTRFFTLGTLWEGLANLLLAPLLFMLVRILGGMADGRRGGFQ